MKRNWKKNWWAIGLSASLLLSAVPLCPSTAQASEEGITLEAEDYIRYSGDISVLTNNSNASGASMWEILMLWIVLLIRWRSRKPEIIK